MPAMPPMLAPPMRASVSFQSRTRLHPAVLVALAATAALFAVIVVQQRSTRLSLPIGSVASSTRPSSEAPQSLPPVTSPTPAPSPTVPAPATVLVPTAAAAVPPDLPPIVTVQQEPQDLPAAPADTNRSQHAGARAATSPASTVAGSGAPRCRCDPAVAVVVAEWTYRLHLLRPLPQAHRRPRLRLPRRLLLRRPPHHRQQLRRRPLHLRRHPR